MSGINWGLLSAILILISGLPYMRAIARREIQRPVLSSWLLWLLIGVILLATSFQAGSRYDTTLFPIIMGVTNPAIIVFLAFKHGDKSWNKIDVACAGLCVITLAVWMSTSDPLLGILGGILTDFIAAVPLMKKAWTDPGDEPVFPWAMFSVASSLNFLAIQQWTPEFWLHPLYGSLGTFLGVVLPIGLHRLGWYKNRP